MLCKPFDSYFRFAFIVILFSTLSANAGVTACLPIVCTMVGDTNANGEGITVTFEHSGWYADTIHLPFGTWGDRAVLADWDGDGRVEPGIAGQTKWRLIRDFDDNRAYTIDSLPETTTPVSGDWNGDGIATQGGYNNGVWTLTNVAPGELAHENRPNTAVSDGTNPAPQMRNAKEPNYQSETTTFAPASGESFTIEYGAPSMDPVVGDWNGDGIDDFGVFDGTHFYLSLGPAPDFANAITVPANNTGVPISGHLGDNRGFVGLLKERLIGDGVPQDAIHVPTDSVPAGGSVIIIPMDMNIEW